MLVKKIGRRILENIVARFNYKLVYEPPFARNKVTERVVYNAFYRGNCFKCFGGTVIGEYMMSGKGWDPQIKLLLEDCLKRKDGDKVSVVEVGANIGASLIPICSFFPNVTFHMFEPIHEFFSLLQENRVSYGCENVCLHNVAVSSENNAEVTIQSDIGNAGKIIIDGPIINKVRVRSRTLDSLFPDKNVAFLKIDVDGYEMAVIEGAKGLIARSRPDVFMEFYPKLIRQMSADPGELLSLLVQCGLTVFDVYSNAGELIKSSVNAGEVLVIAESVPHYVDILARE